jgi:superfamily I DNA and/or RNA helicase
MHTKISSFPNAEFYNSKIRDGAMAADRLSPPLDCFSIPSLPVQSVNLRGEEKHLGTSTENETEADAVKNVIFILLNGGVEEGQIGLTTPGKLRLDCCVGCFLYCVI